MRTTESGVNRGGRRCTSDICIFIFQKHFEITKLFQYRLYYYHIFLSFFLFPLIPNFHMPKIIRYPKIQFNVRYDYFKERTMHTYLFAIKFNEMA